MAGFNFQGLPPVRDMAYGPSRAYQQDYNQGLRGMVGTPQYQALAASNDKARSKIQSQVDTINANEKQAGEDRAKAGPGKREDTTPMSYSPNNYKKSEDPNVSPISGERYDSEYASSNGKTDSSGGFASEGRPQTPSKGLKDAAGESNNFMNYMYGDPHFARGMGDTLSYMPKEDHQAINTFLTNFQDIYSSMWKGRDTSGKDADTTRLQQAAQDLPNPQAPQSSPQSNQGSYGVTQSGQQSAPEQQGRGAVPSGMYGIEMPNQQTQSGSNQYYG